MIYTLDIDSPDLELIFSSLQSARVAKAVYIKQLQARYGRVSIQARQVQSEIDRIGRVMRALEASQSRATAERAVQCSETPARNVSDDLPYVYGKPRNDPRDAQRKPRR